jgi:hypothetical protein
MGSRALSVSRRFAQAKENRRTFAANRAIATTAMIGPYVAQIGSRSRFEMSSQSPNLASVNSAQVSSAIKCSAKAKIAGMYANHLISHVYSQSKLNVTPAQTRIANIDSIS